MVQTRACLSHDEARRLANFDLPIGAGPSPEDAIYGPMTQHVHSCEECRTKFESAKRALNTILPYPGDRCLTDEEIEKHASGEMDDCELIASDDHVRFCDPCNQRIEAKLIEMSTKYCVETGEVIPFGEDGQGYVQHLSSCSACKTVEQDLKDDPPRWPEED